MPNMGGNLIKKWHRSGVRTLRLWVLVSVWIGLKVTESHVAFSSFFFFFFLLRVNGAKDKNYCSCIVHVLLHTIHGSHDTIHIFKNYFATVFSIFSF